MVDRAVIDREHPEAIGQLSYWLQKGNAREPLSPPFGTLRELKDWMAKNGWKFTCEWSWDIKPMQPS